MEQTDGGHRASEHRETGHRAARAVGWPLVLVAAAIATWITIDVLHFGPWTRLDHHASDVIAPWGLHDVPFPRDVVYPLTMFGQRVSILVVIGGFVCWLSWARRTAQPILRFIAALALLTIVIYAFKWGVGRTAPVIDTLHTNGSSYPSGHVPNSLLMWGLIAWLAVEYQVAEWLRRTLNVLRFVAPACAFLGMALLDYHWLSDLVAGVAFGIVLLRLMHLIFDTRIGRLGDSATSRGRSSAVPGGSAGPGSPDRPSPAGSPDSADRPRVS
ncbi:MAG TPA: phosphatase PAP2 family protein [Mycobacteriales bacterium]|nr:phosphatase PAP2 family protein [Mycobacteriales bacterium]